ncbi:hypothetical protein CEXT_71251 [Caerostris extrusa]|uniref:Uncharacterized protein n=1 Tax=Caerostris extrusa TaxID=172846 RepID=A0AAV4U566_CAEEX|nr:hypothetical protein CEXT_71251 [Caerostris extrusa]
MGFISAAAQIMIAAKNFSCTSRTAQIVTAAKTSATRAEVCSIFGNIFMNLRRQGKVGKYRNRNPYRGIATILTYQMN